MNLSSWTKSIANKAGISDFEIGFYKINEQNIEIIHLWSALITMKFGTFCVAVINSDKWRRGYLVIPEHINETQENTKDETLHVVEVDLSDWLDPVEAFLHVMDVIPEIRTRLNDGISCQVLFEARTWETSVFMNINANSEHTKSRELANELLKLAHMISDKSNDKLVQEYMTKIPDGYWVEGFY